MNRITWWTAILLGVALSIVATRSSGQDPAKPEARFDASVPRERQIQLALSAAPAGVSSNASVYILGPKGYEKVREGTNGVSCLVSRSFDGIREVTVEPMCFDPEGSRTLLQVHLHTEVLRATGISEPEIAADIANGYKEGRFKAPGKPGLVYMMSGENYLYNVAAHQGGPFPGHLMFYAPYMTAKDLGYASAATVPFLSKPGQPDTFMIVVPAGASTGSEGGSIDTHKH